MALPGGLGSFFLGILGKVKVWIPKYFSFKSSDIVIYDRLGRVNRWYQTWGILLFWFPQVLRSSERTASLMCARADWPLVM